MSLLTAGCETRMASAACVTEPYDYGTKGLQLAKIQSNELILFYQSRMSSAAQAAGPSFNDTRGRPVYGAIEYYNIKATVANWQPSGPYGGERIDR